MAIIIQISYTVRIPILWLVDLYQVTLGYDETTSLTSLSWCKFNTPLLLHHGFGWLKVWRFLFAVYSIWIIKILTLSLFVNYFLFSLISIYILGAFLTKQLFHSRLLDIRLVTANSALRASLAICHLISNKREWNNC